MSSRAGIVDHPQLAGDCREAVGRASQSSVPMECLLCRGARHRVVATELDIDILRCDTCGHVFSSFPSDPHYSGFWGDEVAASEHLYWSKARARMHSDFFKRFVAGRSGRLLDMGCGLGFFLKAMASYKAWDAYGCEISPAAVRYAREQLRLDKVICTRLQEADLPPASFDMIVMWDVLDHIPRPDPLLSHCRSLLKEDGILFIRSPNVVTQLFRARLMYALGRFQTGRKYLQASDHPHLYSMRSMRTLLERNGLGDVSFIHLHPIGSDGGTDWKSGLATSIKNMAFQMVRALAVSTGGRQNLDNLFVIARKGAALRPT